MMKYCKPQTVQEYCEYENVATTPSYLIPFLTR